MKYISLLRGINVSGQKKIKMNDLKSLYEELGFQNVVTYIQSGNVIFTTKISKKLTIKESIEKAIEGKYQFSVAVVIRTNKDFDNIIQNCPFSGINLEKEGTKLLVSFLSEKPNKSHIEKLMEKATQSEKIELVGKELFLYCPNGYGKSKLANNFIESKLGVISTTRNWKSIHKLHELSR